MKIYIAYECTEMGVIQDIGKVGTDYDSIKKFADERGMEVLTVEDGEEWPV